ncbi:MAG: nicotinate-nucleotide adenylyltransferase [Pyrinomonadaceae bacterium]
MPEERRIAVYGGSFDPVHNGHLAIARRLTELLRVDEFLLLPAHIAPHKRGAGVTPALHRHAMLALATQNDERLMISTLELESPEKPYTVETLGRLAHARGAENLRIVFVMGADSWAEITMWREWERLLTMVDHFVVTRPGNALKLDHVTPEIIDRVTDLRGAETEEIRRAVRQSVDGRRQIYFTDAVMMDVSSTAIRHGVRAGRRGELRSSVPPCVADYIEKYKLYQSEREAQATDVERARAH